MRQEFKSSLLAFLVLATLVLTPGCGFFRKKDPESAANAFFALLNQGKTKEAYESATFSFQTEQDFPTFDAMVRELGMSSQASFEWNQRDVTDKQADLNGTLTGRSGTRTTVAVTMIPEGGAWRVYSLRTGNEHDAAPTQNVFSLVGRGANFNSATNKTIPSQAELKGLIRETVLNFGQAIEKKNFDDFYNYVAVAWQDELSEKRLQRAFQAFIDNGVKISGIEHMEPTFDNPPGIDTDGLLELSGYYDTSPYKVLFKAKYIYEYPKWKLFGLNVNLAR